MNKFTSGIWEDPEVRQFRFVKKRRYILDSPLMILTVHSELSLRQGVLLAHFHHAPGLLVVAGSEGISVRLAQRGSSSTFMFDTK